MLRPSALMTETPQPPSGSPAGTPGPGAGTGPTPPGAPPEGGAEEAARRLEERREDHELVRRAKQGDEQAFADLVQRHQRRAWRVARNLVPRGEDADDIVQEAFLRVFRKLDSFDFDYAFKTWLFRIVTNLAIDHLRKRRPIGMGTEEEDDRPMDVVDEGVEDPAAALERSETAAEVRACIDTLAPHFRSVMVLRELEGLPCTEIAEIVGATHVTVRWRLHRGRKLFQEEWERRRREADGPLGASPGEGADETGRKTEMPSNGASPDAVDPGEAT